MARPPKPIKDDAPLTEEASSSMSILDALRAASRETQKSGLHQAHAAIETLLHTLHNAQQQARAVADMDGGDASAAAAVALLDIL